MDIKRYIIVQALLGDDNKLIPIWNNQITFHNDDYYGKLYKYENRTYQYVVECIFDTKTKELLTGIELDYYPDENELPYKIDQIILFEEKHHTLREAKIESIVYEEYELSILKGKKIDEWVKKRFPKVTFGLDTIYAIKNWKPYYMLNNGNLIKSEYDLYTFNK